MSKLENDQVNALGGNDRKLVDALGADRELLLAMGGDLPSELKTLAGEDRQLAMLLANAAVPIES